MGIAGATVGAIAGLSKPATTLIERVSDAIGGIAKPWQMERVAKAEAKVGLIKTNNRIEISELEERALRRMVKEEGQKQANIESIVDKALPLIRDDATPENVEPDWYTYFFDKNRLVSDTDMQIFWAKMLAQQANSPGHYSKRTIDLVATFERSDFKKFTRFCSTMWFFPKYNPVVFNPLDTAIANIGITFDDLTHLDHLGLIRYDAMGGFGRKGFGKQGIVRYFDKIILITFPTDANNILTTGRVLFTKSGEELATACGSTPSDECYFYAVEKWIEQGLTLLSPLPT